MLSEGACPSRNTPTRVTVPSRIKEFLPRSGIEKPPGNSSKQKCGCQQNRGLSTRTFALARDDSSLSMGTNRRTESEGRTCRVTEQRNWVTTREDYRLRLLSASVPLWWIFGFTPACPACLRPPVLPRGVSGGSHPACPALPRGRNCR